MTKKRIFVIGLIVFGILLQIAVILFVVTLPWSVLLLGLILSPNPPKPELTYGEFPFELVYEIDGETVTVNDVYVCKFDGFGMNEGRGKYREWKGYVQGTGEEGVILWEQGETVVWCYVETADYYMDDEKYERTQPPRPNVVEQAPWNSVISYTGLTEDELWELYNIRIISWQFSDPVENSFD